MATSTVNNSLQNKKPSFAAFMTSDAVKAKVNSILGGKDGQRFISAIISATTVNPMLQDCDNMSIFSAAMLGESLKLSPSPQLGQYYMVPFSDATRGKVATFILGWKGMVQLAIRSGYYKRLVLLSLKEGEVQSYNPLTEELNVKLIEDEEEREAAKTCGYYAMFEYQNGFQKSMYWSKKKMEAHAQKYSKGYASRKGYTFWEKGQDGFDNMALKTMCRQLLSKFGIMSIEMQTAYETDTAIINEDGSVEFFDNDSSVVEGVAPVTDIKEDAAV